MDDTNGMSGTGDDGFDESAFAEAVLDEAEFGTGLLEEELRRAAAVLDPVPVPLRQLAVEAYALHDLDAGIAELTFDSVVDALPVRGAAQAPRMLTFHSGGVTVDVEIGGDGLMGQVLPPQPARVEVLGGPRTVLPLVADAMGRFTSDVSPSGPFALRLRTGDDVVVVTQWLRA